MNSVNNEINEGNPLMSYPHTSAERNREQKIATELILGEVARERDAQDAKWGEQNHPNGTGGTTAVGAADDARRACEEAFGRGAGTWAHILHEEVWEAFAEEDPDKLRTELIQVAAVATAWAEAIDRRSKRGEVSRG